MRPHGALQILKVEGKLEIKKVKLLNNQSDTSLNGVNKGTAAVDVHPCQG